MKIQLQQQALRLRIDETELAQLLAGTSVVNVTHWPDARVERQQLRLDAQSGWQRNVDGWCIALCDAAVRELAARLPSRDGLSFELPCADGDTLHVLFDVDVRDSARRLRAHREARA